MSVLVLTFLIHSLTCSPLFAQTYLPSSDYDLNMTTETSEDVTRGMGSPNFSMFTPQPSNVPVRETTAVPMPENTAITVAETESILETTIAAILKTTEVPSTEVDSEDTFETTPKPSIEYVTSSISQTLEGTRPQTPIQTSHHVSRVVPTQATTPETFASTPFSSASQNEQSSTKSTVDDVTSKSNPTKTLTVVTPSMIPESAKTSFSKPSSDLKPTSTVGSTASSPTPVPIIQGFGIVIIIIALVVCMSGIIFMSMFFNKRRKRRSENFSYSFRTGGSSKSKMKKGTDDDAWFGPVALKGDEAVEAGEEGGNEVDGDGEGVQVVLSTFMAKEEEKDGVNGSCVGAKEDIKKDEEVPLLITDEDVEKAVSHSPPLSSSLSPPLSETAAGEQNGSPAFCLTSAV
ncbi:mucin-2-like [Anguilla rostrata]|uniref:mucin-2-like n=1 Tax=Anguilla rostrata TaxID=7938 RepID=UPI0030CDFD59